VQSDTDQIRQKLSTQQSILDRIMRQLSSTSGNSSNRGSRPQSASGGSNSQHSTGGPSTAVVPEYSFMGVEAGGAGLGAQWGAQYNSRAAEGTGGDAGLLTAVHEQLQAHHESLEQLAEAVSLLATGQAAAPAAAAPAGSRAAPGAAGGMSALQVESQGVDLAAGRSGAADEDGSVPETPNLRFQRGPAAAAGSSGAMGSFATAGGAAAGRPGTPLGASAGRAGSMQPAGSAGSGGAGRWEGQGSTATTAPVLHPGPGPQVAQLKRLLQTGQVGRKMDWFDPTLLQKMVSGHSSAALAWSLLFNSQVGSQ